MTRGMGGQSPSNVTHHLKGIDFPADKRALLQHARRNGADDEVIEILEQMPEQEYGNMADVMKGFGRAN